MASVFDVAKYILHKQGTITHMKLQKLCYYAQAWSLVWDEEPLFTESVEAWANGPVIRPLYHALKGKFNVCENNLQAGDWSRLSENQKQTIDAVLDHYGDKSSHYLSELTHLEQPWLEARREVPPGERSEAQISHAMMAEYYGSL